MLRALSPLLLALFAGCSSASFDVATPPSDAAGEATADSGASVCGDRHVGDGEECDDGNDTNGDGCDTDCHFSCDSKSSPERKCDDGKACNGPEFCDATHRCVSSQPKSCPSPDACTSTACVEPGTCTSKKIDSDGDGQSPRSLGACGSDCDDTDGLSFAGQPKFFTGPNKRGTFDYDCDGLETKQYDLFVKCDTSGGGCTLAAEGWFYAGGATPACGTLGDWVSECFVNGSNVCIPRPASTTKRQQACR
jgi:cysteine-rich repeat protein